ncbi:MAG: response regulator [Bacteroidota bacterium]
MKLKCVLLIDDDEIINFLNHHVLSDTGIAQSIEIVETVKDALQLLENREVEGCSIPELIFLDLNMPGLNGWDFIEEYKKIKNAHGLNCVIVVLTTSVNPDDNKKANQISEIAEFRSKPMTYEMIHEIVHKYFAA